MSSTIDCILVSIIIPAFNVQKYIEQCILSVINQTHKNIEIVVVNDGSRDKTLSLVECMAKSDSRIRIINIENSGVSVARNKGIEASNGDYIIFVDGDDYILPDFVFSFLQTAQHFGSDFVFSTKCIISKSWKEEKPIVRRINNEQAVSSLLNPDVIVGCWNKIYKASFLKEKGIFFDNGLFYGEGLRFITKVAQCAKNIVSINAKKYCYRRNNETSATTVFNIKKYINGAKSLYYILDDIDKNNKSIYDIWILHLALFYLGGITNMLTLKVKNEYIDYYEKWISFLKKERKRILLSKNISLRRKTMVIFGSFFPRAVSRINNFRKRKIAQNSIE